MPLFKPSYLFAIFLNILCFGHVLAAPTDAEEHARYTRSLNTMAAHLMTWYGSLISNTSTITFLKTSQSWDKYRAQYPSDIEQIHILETDLQKLPEESHYQFNVTSSIMHSNEQLQQLEESFVFKLAVDGSAKIEQINRSENITTGNINHKQKKESHDGMYYKSREFAYAWLAFLDGAQANQTQSLIQAEKWLDTAEYSIKIGSKTIKQPVNKALKERQQFLTRGGHTLRLVDVKKLENKQDTYLLDLTMNWKGSNTKGKTVIAKINQKIEFKINDDNLWHVISIDEKHLLPDLTPWQDLLC